MTRARRTLVVAAATFLAALLCVGTPVLAQEDPFGYGTPDNPGEIDFDRPESWAMKYFTSVALLTGLGVPGGLGSSGFLIAFEGGYVPTLSDAQRTVGFNGTKREDLNKTSAFGRVRVTAVVGSGIEITGAYVPPVELNGAKPHLFAAAIGVPLVRADGWRLGARAYGQVGAIEGDFTCDQETVDAGSDPVANPFGCDALSSDKTHQNYLGGEVGAAASAGRVEPYVTLGANWFTTKFETDAITNGTPDHSTFETSGLTFHGTAGLRFELTPRVLVSGEVFYSPLGVDRMGSGTSANDGLLNGRALFAFRF